MTERDVWGIRRPGPAGGDRDRSSWIKLIGFLVLTLALTYGWMALRSRIALTPAEGAPPASPLVVRTADGEEVALASLRGKVVLVNLWASWCRPCRAEIPALNRAHRELADRGLVVLGVNVQAEDREGLAAEVEGLSILYPVALPATPFDGTWSGPRTIPRTWLIDRAGRVRADHTGAVSSNALYSACRELLDES